MSSGVTQVAGVSAVQGMAPTDGAVTWPDGTPPANSNSPGVAGTTIFAGPVMYRCYAPNLWVEFQGTTF